MSSTITRDQASNVSWDAIVIGAGIAGCLAAAGLARLGRRVLLVEKSKLPRDKVCGACLNLDAIAGLRAAGVWEDIVRLRGHDLGGYCVRSPGNREMKLSLPGGHAVSRYAMDRVLARAAIDAGADYLDQTVLN
ncbi:MAG: FAD-dependent oxidoreductase, partial [Planctomycetota bacterium]